MFKIELFDSIFLFSDKIYQQNTQIFFTLENYKKIVFKLNESICKMLQPVPYGIQSTAGAVPVRNEKGK